MNGLKQKLLLCLRKSYCPKYESNATRDVYDHLEMSNTKFFPQKYIKTIRKMQKKSVKFTTNDTLCRLTVFSYKKNESYIKFFVHFIATCINIMEDVFGKNVNDFQIFLALTKYSKQLPNNKVITPENMNSGFTYISFDSCPMIWVYRKEEICKVIIHEMLHLYQVHPFDYPLSIDEKIIKKYDIRVKHEDSLNIYEAYVEAIAVYINMIIYEQLFDEKNVFSKEMTHQLYLINQLHQFRGYLEETNVFAYVFLKYNILKNLDKVLLYTEKNNYCISDMKIIQKHLYNIKFDVLPSKIYSKKIRLHKMDIFKSI